MLLDPTDTSRPLVLQEHQARWVYCNSFSPFLAGGWGSGKSIALLAKAYRLSMLNPPRTNGAIVFPTGPLLSKFLIEQFMPSFDQVIVREGKKDGYVVLEGGRKIWFLSSLLYARLEAINLAWCLSDEIGLSPPEVFRKMIARVRDKRAEKHGLLQVGLTGVPLYGWLKDEFGGRHDNKRAIFHVRTDQNTMVADSYKENLRSQCSGSQARCYLEGQFVPPGGGVWPEVSHERHFIDYKFDPNIGVAISVDWSPRNPCCIFAQFYEPGMVLNGRRVEERTFVVFDEMHLDGHTTPITTDRFAAQIKAKCYPINYCCADPAGKGVEATSGVDQITLFERALGLRVNYRTDNESRSIPIGVEHLRRLFDPLGKHPRVFFSKSLLSNKDPRACAQALFAYSYQVEKSGRPLSNLPLKDGVTDHFADTLRYLAVNQISLVERVVTFGRLVYS